MPNAMGVAFNAASLLLCVVFPARDRQSSDDKQPGAFKRMLQAMKGEKAVSAVEEAADSHEIDLAVEAVSQHAHTK